ncbi:MAG: hypothetical protein L6R41_000224 [Letrouitia leprolyta]|nr:MAG: hypothetical protein L6R41_000224 [Letrouitia leprolyta]
MRLICHYFNEASLPILFDRVILSDQRQNFAPFNNITSDSRLGAHVKTLVYDMQWFEDLKKNYYIFELYKQLQEDVAARKDELGSSLSSSQLEEKMMACDYFKDPGTTHDRERLLIPWNRYVRKGYQEYRKQWREQTLGDSQISSCILRAFRHCPNVRHVEVRASWDFHYEPLDDSLESLLPRYLSSGFVGRSWHPLYLRPKKMAQITLNKERIVSDTLNAISCFSHKVLHFSLGNGCAFSPRMHKEPQEMLSGVPCVFRNLTSLSLDIGPDHPTGSSYIMDYLSPALHAAHNLRQLTFRAKNYSKWRHKDDMRLYMYHHFSDYVFPKLTHLYLMGMAATAKQFLIFLSNQPLLQALHLESIDLWGQMVASDEDWKYFFDHLRQISLKEFSVTWPLRRSEHLSNHRLECPHICVEDQWSQIKASIEKYVLNGDISLRLG